MSLGVKVASSSFKTIPALIRVTWTQESPSINGKPLSSSPNHPIKSKISPKWCNG
ncbi:uncharacterized protein MYCGRDRAFT_81286 [Zymoseptoria tritici IPO323]|uniref:Uncharacterized protein n=1 Tax=Zymoseptoria tritici (strain CBS 115943 / IPO323) TaxID=336722 RepID=F9XDS8_ZYMTI|nr:uncharacterized protein MYCGRDRAFT_81286 [Zymoseptoria tritici IPO323]EGP86547.1 hypothetical protein MYCGRDRAFT_81286 [Zymoseptoria tritici IPO323]